MLFIAIYASMKKLQKKRASRYSFNYTQTTSKIFEIVWVNNNIKK